MNKSQTLFSQDTFYSRFLRDLAHARAEVIIESPFITERRFNELLPTLTRLSRRGVSIIVNTRNPLEHEEPYVAQGYAVVAALQDLGIKVLYTTKLHRKLAVIDQEIVWEGSLNILSFNDSCELMRRQIDRAIANDTKRFLRIYN